MLDKVHKGIGEQSTQRNFRDEKEKLPINLTYSLKTISTLWAEEQSPAEDHLFG